MTIFFFADYKDTHEPTVDPEFFSQLLDCSVIMCLPESALTHHPLALSMLSLC